VSISTISLDVDCFKSLGCFTIQIIFNTLIIPSSFSVVLKMVVAEIDIRSNCFFECSLQAAQQQLSQFCTPWFLPVSPSKSKVCNTWGARELVKAMQMVDVDSQCVYCLPECSKTMYHSSISTQVSTVVYLFLCQN